MVNADAPSGFTDNKLGATVRLYTQTSDSSARWFANRVRLGTACVWRKAYACRCDVSRMRAVEVCVRALDSRTHKARGSAANCPPPGRLRKRENHNRTG